MKEYLINKGLQVIRKSNPNYSKEKMAELRFGLTGIYCLVGKFFLITSLAIILRITKEYLFFCLFFSTIRSFSFGLHANKSWVCLLSSTIIFLLIPYLCGVFYLSNKIKIIIGAIGIIIVFKYSPADTPKRPIVNKKRRIMYRTLSTFIAISYTIIALIINNQIISNCLLFSIILQCLMVAPVSYKLLGIPYNNYKRIREEEF